MELLYNSLEPQALPLVGKKECCGHGVIEKLVGVHIPLSLTT